MTLNSRVLSIALAAFALLSLSTVAMADGELAGYCRNANDAYYLAGVGADHEFTVSAALAQVSGGNMKLILVAAQLQCQAASDGSAAWNKTLPSSTDALFVDSNANSGIFGSPKEYTASFNPSALDSNFQITLPLADVLTPSDLAAFNQGKNVTVQLRLGDSRTFVNNSLVLTATINNANPNGLTVVQVSLP